MSVSLYEYLSQNKFCPIFFFMGTGNACGLFKCRYIFSCKNMIFPNYAHKILAEKDAIFTA